MKQLLVSRESGARRQKREEGVSAIKNVLFDIGKVLLSFEREQTISEFARYSLSVDEKEFGIEHVFVDSYWERMETGHVSPEQYYERFCEASGCAIGLRHFVLIWTMNFTPVAEMIAYGRALAEKYNIYFFSNTDPIHIPPLYNRFPSLLFFRGQALSWELGVRKPDPEFFRRGLAKFDLDPRECLFVDDRQENAEAAARLGIRSVVFSSPSQAIAEMDAVLAGS
ncbi:MAG: HAD family phosphatase [Candidatus Glassbacteria bacterium]|nr:HAD family phosphatase [Candidatus Glassbacteria bacterium]